MRKLFIHHPIFRLLSPIFSGVLVYLLLLLINNNIDQLQGAFLSEELYVCIVLAYLIQESSRFSLLFFDRRQRPKSFLVKLTLQIAISVAITLLLVTLFMYLYFKYVLFYTPNMRELFIFNVIFGFIAIIYITLYLSHHFLYKINTEKITTELEVKHSIEEDFIQFKKGINPQLLYESLEAMLVLMKRDTEAAEQLVDHFATVYRYILAKNKRELVPIEEELMVLHELIKLFNHLPYRHIELISDIKGHQWTVTTSLLLLVESIIRTTIASKDEKLTVHLQEHQNWFQLSYAPQDKLAIALDETTIQTVCNSYSFYALEKVQLFKKDGLRVIQLPKLNYDEHSNY